MEEVNKIDYAIHEINRLHRCYKMKLDILRMFKILCKYDVHDSVQIILWLIDLIKQTPLTSLTGEDKEWELAGDNLINKRCPSLVKQGEKVYNTHGYCYSEPNSDEWFYVPFSVKDIEFPCNREELRTEHRRLLFNTRYIPLKWAIKLHLYTRVL